MRAVRFLSMAVVSCASLLLLGMPSASGLLQQGASSCDAFTDIQQELENLGTQARSGGIGIDDYTSVGAAFRAAATEDAPRKVKAALKKLGKLYSALGKYDDPQDAQVEFTKNPTKFQKPYAKFATYVDTNCAGSGSDSGATTGSSGRGGSLTLGGESIALDSARCYLKEQVAAGQKIEFTGQAMGKNSAGDDVILDVSRYAPDSRFAGDDVSVDVGDFRSDDADRYEGRASAGAITRQDSRLSANNFNLRADDGSTVVASFQIKC